MHVPPIALWVTVEQADSRKERGPGVFITTSNLPFQVTSSYWSSAYSAMLTIGIGITGLQLKRLIFGGQAQSGLAISWAPFGAHAGIFQKAQKTQKYSFPQGGGHNRPHKITVFPRIKNKLFKKLPTPSPVPNHTGPKKPNF